MPSTLRLWCPGTWLWGWFPRGKAVEWGEATSSVPGWQHGSEYKLSISTWTSANTASASLRDHIRLQDDMMPAQVLAHCVTLGQSLPSLGLHV